MTVIAGLVHGGRVYIGGDSAGIANLDLTVRKDPKVFTLGEMVVGTSWNFRPAHLMAHAFKPPPLPRRSADLMRYMVVDFINALRAVHKEHGWVQTNSGRDAGDFNALVGVRGRLFTIHGDYQVGEARDGWDAIGCGSSYAQGAIYATPKMKPEPRIRLALRAAERHSAGVRGPFIVLATPAKGA